MKSGLAFVEPVRLDQTTRSELSDHYGVRARVAVAPRDRSQTQRRSSPSKRCHWGSFAPAAVARR